MEGSSMSVGAAFPHNGEHCRRSDRFTRLAACCASKAGGWEPWQGAPAVLWGNGTPLGLAQHAERGRPLDGQYCGAARASWSGSEQSPDRGRGPSRFASQRVAEAPEPCLFGHQNDSRRLGRTRGGPGSPGFPILLGCPRRHTPLRSNESLEIAGLPGSRGYRPRPILVARISSYASAPSATSP
jgi:hypothetical protein